MDDAPPYDERLTARMAGPVVFAAVALGYLGLAQFVIWINDPVYAGAGLWTAAGLTVAALLLLPTRLWGWVLAAVFVAEVGGDLAHGYSVVASLGWAAANAAEPLVGALLLRRFGNPRGALTPARSLMLFLGLAVLAAPLVGASIGSLATMHETGAALSAVWPKFYVGDALGVLIVAPALLTLRLRGTRRSRLEGAALIGGVVVVSVAVFGGSAGSGSETMAYLLIPFLTWAALRHGIRATAWLSLAIALMANVFTAAGDGPFSEVGLSSGHTVTLLQTFLGISVASAFVLAAIVSELLDRDQVEDALRHQATHDLLTGLPNRARLATALDSALDHGAGGGVALLVCDIDHLKSVNDRLGHRAGDELISQVAVRLRRSVRPDDLVTRISGDEFVVVLKGVDAADIEALCRRIIETAAEPMILGARAEATTSLSIGVALSEPGMSGEDLFNGADTALYEAKRLGRGRTVHFDDRLRREARERLAIEGDLPRALAEGHIRCLHQPEILLATGELFGFESLARWHHPERGLITPDRFISAVDATGNAGLLFEAVLAQTLEAQRRWAGELGFHPRVAVNLSALQLDDPELPATITRALARADAPADALWLELTETDLADASALSSLNALAALGVHLALDDFGTGWSSMSRLSQYPWELLKLDRTFIAPLGTDPDAEHVVRAMIVMAHALGIPTVAEGVETLLQLDRLRALGCDIVQGFLFSRPVAAADAVALVGRDGRWAGRPSHASFPAVSPGSTRGPARSPGRHPLAVGHRQ